METKQATAMISKFKLLLSASCLCVMALCPLWSQQALANGTGLPDDEALADALIEHIGLSAQIDRTGDTISSEVLAARTECEQSTLDTAELAEFLRELFQPEALAATLRQQLTQSLSAQDKAGLYGWINSELGRKVYAAESALKNVDAERISQLEKELIGSAHWTGQRQRSIYRIVRVTRIHHYIAALNTSLSAAVAMASSCQADGGTLNSIEIANKRDRVDEKLVAKLMINHFVVPTGVILESLSDDELQQYFLFSSSAMAQRWYALVIDMVRSMIVQRVPRIRSYLAANG